MIDFTENLRQLVERGDVDKATALEVAPNPEAAEDGAQGHQGRDAGHSVIGVKDLEPMKREELQIANCKLQIANWKAGRTAIAQPSLQTSCSLQFAICILQFAICNCLFLPPSSCLRRYLVPARPRLLFQYFQNHSTRSHLLCLDAHLLVGRRRCARLKLPTELWNPLLFSCGLAGLVVVWLLPWFWISLLLLLALYLVPTFAYVNLRNEQVPADEKVLTKRHLRELSYRYLGFKRPAEEEKERRLPIRFISKSSKGEVDARRMARAQESKGYRRRLRWSTMPSRSAPPTFTWNRPRKR